MYTEPCFDWGTWNSFSSWEELQISKRQGPSLSGFRTISSLEAEGDGTMAETPVNSIGKGAQWNATVASLCLSREAETMDFFLLLVKRLGWLTQNIACEAKPAMQNETQIVSTSTGKWSERWRGLEWMKLTGVGVEKPCLVDGGDGGELVEQVGVKGVFLLRGLVFVVHWWNWWKRKPSSAADWSK